MKRKISVVLLIVSMLASVFTGCGNKETENVSTAEAETQETPVVTDETESMPEEIFIDVDETDETESMPEEEIVDVDESDEESADSNETGTEQGKAETGQTVGQNEGTLKFELNGEELTLPCDMGYILAWGSRNGLEYQAEEWGMAYDGGKRVMLFPRSEEIIPGSLVQIAPDAPCVAVAYGVSTSGEDVKTEELTCYSVEVAISKWPDVSIGYNGLSLSGMSTYEEWVAALGESSEEEDLRDAGMYDWDVGKLNGENMEVCARDYGMDEICEIAFIVPLDAK